MWTQDPIPLVKAAAENFEIEPDLATLDRIKTSLESLKNKRLDTIDDEKETLRLLTKKYDEMKQQLQQQESSETRYDMKKQLATLEANKFELAKTLTDLEIGLNELNSNSQNLAVKLNELTRQQDEIIDNDFHENYDSIVLKLKLYRKMGLILELDDDGTDKIITYNKEDDSTNILKVGQEYSGYFVSNYIWERL